jgi:diaminopimelate epimerase
MRFVKMHGIGNDYVYLDAFTDPALDKKVDLKRLARAMSDRHTGIGSDGIILVGRPSDRAADVRMRMFNADGSESEMCGNGVRCVAKFAYDRLGLRRSPMRVQTGRGVLPIDYITQEGKVVSATVDMGEPILDAEKIPVELPRPAPGGRVVDFPLAKYIPLEGLGEAHWMEDSELDQRMTCVSMGNPHAVIFCGHVESVPLEVVGPVIETQPIFPNRTNVHFVEVKSPTEAVMRTWERGAGATRACGTGACASLVAGALTGRLGRKAVMRLPGGPLEIVWDERANRVLMTGPATEVFVGEWPD